MVRWNSVRAATPFDACGHSYLELPRLEVKLTFELLEVLLPGCEAGLLTQTLRPHTLEPALQRQGRNKDVHIEPRVRSSWVSGTRM